MPKTFKELAQVDEACWIGYRQDGMKSKGGRQVPNCVKEEFYEELFGEINDLRGSLSDAQLERMKQDWKNKPASAVTSGLLSHIKNLDAPTKAALANAKINHISKIASEGVMSEEKELDESKMDDIFIMSDEGSTPEQIAKELNLSLKVVKSVLSMMDEEVNEETLTEFTPAMLTKLKKEYEPLKGKTMSINNINKMNAMLSKMSTPLIVKLANADIPFLSTGAVSTAVSQRGMKWSDFKKPLDMSEVDLSKSQVKMVHKKADDMPKQDFIKKYGKNGDAVRYATATKIVKKKLGMEEELEEETSPKVAYALKQYVAQNPAFWTGNSGKADKKDYEELMTLALKDMDAFYKKVDSMDTNPRDGVYQALKNKGLSIGEQNINKGELTMNESYKDKFNATMKDFGINSLDDLKSDEEKKKFFKAVDKSHVAKNEIKEQLNSQDLEKMKRAFTLGSAVIVIIKGRTYVAAPQSVTVGGKIKASDGIGDYYSFNLSDVSSVKSMTEELTPAQKKLPAGLQKAIAAKQGDKKKEETLDEAQSLDDLKKMLDRTTLLTPKEKKDIQSLEKSKGSNAYHKVLKQMFSEEDAYDNERFIIIDGKAKKDDGNTPDKKDHVYAPDAKTALQLHKQGKKVYRESVDPSCPICEGEACQCAQAPSDTESVSEMKMNAMKMNAMKMPINSMMVKTAQDDAKPMADLSTSYSKDDVRASVKDGGGKDMAKVNDTPEMMAAMKKINATYRKEKYLPVKEGSIEDAILNMKMLEEQTVNIKGKELDDMIKQYLAKGGTVTKLPPALAKGMKPSGQATFKVGDKGIIKSMYKMKEVREFVSTYNLHFLSNYKAEELMVEARYEVSHDYGSRFGSYGVILTAVVDATSPQDAMKKGHDKLETLSMSAQGKKLGVDELQDPDDEGKPTVKQTSKPITYTDMKKV